MRRVWQHQGMSNSLRRTRYISIMSLLGFRLGFDLREPRISRFLLFDDVYRDSHREMGSGRPFEGRNRTLVVTFEFRLVDEVDGLRKVSLRDQSGNCGVRIRRRSPFPLLSSLDINIPILYCVRD